jgi:hypothetical protein
MEKYLSFFAISRYLRFLRTYCNSQPQVILPKIFLQFTHFKINYVFFFEEKLYHASIFRYSLSFKRLFFDFYVAETSVFKTKEQINMY